LAEALGIAVIVDKRREILLFHNVRIHLDDVAGLGTFLEFEAVLSGDIDPARGEAQIDFLRNEFGIAAEDLLAVSYAELLLQRMPEKR
jgi:predicted adenylyl cyclase CyaB